MAIREPDPNCRCNVGVGVPGCPLHGPHGSTFAVKDFEFKVPEFDKDNVITDIHIDGHTDYRTCMISACPECKQESERGHDHTKFIGRGEAHTQTPPEHVSTSPGTFHGILPVTETALLEALGIHDESVHVVAINRPFGKLVIEIQLASCENQIDVGDGSIIRMYKVSEGAPVPYTQPTVDEEQRENILRPVLVTPRPRGKTSGVTI